MAVPYRRLAKTKTSAPLRAKKTELEKMYFVALFGQLAVLGVISTKVHPFRFFEVLMKKVFTEL